MTRPNIVFITTDQQRASLMGCAGHPVVRTPHMDFLARAGVRFDRAYSPTPMCVPARTIVMTGCDGYRSGVLKNGDVPIRRSETLPALLGRGGYQTRAVGKMHFFPQRCCYGFDHMLLCEEGRPIKHATAKGSYHAWDDYENFVAERGYPGEAWSHGMANNEPQASTWHLPDELHPTEWIGKESCRAIKTRDWTRPLFLWSSFTAPHPPLVPLVRDVSAYQHRDVPMPVQGDWTGRLPLKLQARVARYGASTNRAEDVKDTLRAFYALVTQVDRQIYRILGTLREEGILDTTWIVFASDHGDYMGDHGLWAKGEHFEGSARVPLIITPARAAWETLGDAWCPGQVSRAVVGLQDVLPTCLDIAGLPIPSDLDGRSLLPLVHDPSAAVRDVLFGESGTPGQRAFMATDGVWKYLWFEEDGRELLFNLDQDSGETRDRAGDPEAGAHVWRGRLATWLAAREQDPAVRKGASLVPQLVPSGSERDLSDVEWARLANNRLPRGLH